MLYSVFILVFPLLGLVTWLTTRFTDKVSFNWRYPCKLYVCLLFLVVGVYGHLIQPQAVMDLMPPWMPLQLITTYLTGVLELAFVVLLWTRFQRPVAWIIIAYLFVTIPFNIYGWTLPNNTPNYIDDPYYLWFRVPLQVALGLLTYYGTHGRFFSQMQ